MVKSIRPRSACSTYALVICSSKEIKVRAGQDGVLGSAAEWIVVEIPGEAIAGKGTLSVDSVEPP